MKRVAVLGAGMAGFGACHALREAGLRPVLFDKLDHFGGHTSSYTIEGFTFDEGPHVSFTKDERIRALLAGNINQEYVTLKARVNNYWRGHWIKHPAQVNLHGLPEDLVVRIVMDFVESQRTPAEKPANYGEWLYAAFGKTFAETFPMEYTVKYHTTPAANMSTDWLGPRLYRPKLEEVIRGTLSAQTANVHYVEEVRYPARGGFNAYLHRFARETELRLGHDLAELDPSRRRLRFTGGETAEYDEVISSMPLPELIERMPVVPRNVAEAARALACTEAVIVTIGVNRADLVDAHWSYFYDRDVFFTRLSTPHLQSPNNAPPGCGLLQAECYFSRKYRPLDRRPEQCIEPVIDGLRKCGILREDDRIMMRHALRIPYANIIFDLDRAGALPVVHEYLRDAGVHWCGRYGEWGYLWTDEAFISGEKAAAAAMAGG